MRTTSTRFGLTGLFVLLLNALCWPAHGQYGGGSASIQGTLVNTSATVYNGSTLTIGCTYRFTVSAPSCTVANVTWSLPSGMTGVTVGSAGLNSSYVDLTFSTQAVTNPQLHAAVGWTCPPSGGSQPPYPPGAVDAQFSLSSSSLGYVSLVASANPVCANTSFTLSLGYAAGVTSVTWSRSGFQPVTTTDASQNFAFTVSGGITASTVYQAQIRGGCDPNAPPVTQTITINPLTDGASQAAGERDVPTGNNQGTVTLTNYYGTILYWQTSQDGGASWQTVSQTTEDLAYANLTATTQYRAVTSRCGNIFTSAPCTVRVHAATDDISWTETTAFNLSGTIIGDSRTYVDGFGKTLQNQSKNLTTKQVLATQPLYGKYGQVVGSTLAAPIPSPAYYFYYGTDFKYTPTFITPASAAGTAYDYTRFDDTSTLNSPEAVNTASPGTLGWYYSTNNTLEPYVATTGYPYSRSDAMSDGSSGVSRAVGPGAGLQMGSNHEVVQGSFPVRTELDDYAGIRSKLVAAAAVGGQPVTLQQAAMQSLSTDADGKSALVFADKQGHAVMSARPATNADAWTTATNVVEVGWPHSIQLTSDFAGPQFQATADIMVYDNNKKWVMTGAPADVAQSLGFGQNLNQYWFYSTDPFTVTGNANNTFASQQREAYPFFNFYVVGGGTVFLYTLGNTPTSVCHLINSVTGAEVALPSQPNGAISVAPGCYQLRIEQGAVQLKYINYYKDLSYNFYNQKGQLVESIAPNGVQQLLQNWRAAGPAGFSYTPTSAHPFSTTFEYDQQGRQTAMTEPDAGRTVFVYRTDGKLRFSQNAKQLATGAFSYLNYDPIGRVTEAAECRPSDASFFNTRKTDGPTLEYISTAAYSDGGLGQQERRDVVETFYDRASYSFTLPSGYTPAFLAGRVAATAKLSVFLPNAYSTEISHTLYSYDDQGRTQWLVQQTAGQPARTVDYAYDAAGNAQSVCYQKNTPAERFSHYYRYDADNRLTYVDTDKNDPANLPPYASFSFTRQATYSYYTHGPLKRVVYGTNLQGMDYTYTAAGQLKAINDGYQQLDPGKDGVASGIVYPDFFGTALNYYPNDYASAGAPNATTNMTYVGGSSSNYQPHYNGLVSGTVWQTPDSPYLQGYGYKYDYKDQLLQADHGALLRSNNQYIFVADPNRYAESNLDYDPNGNIGHLQRTDNTGGTPLMNISYDYLPGTNKLNAVKDVTSGAPTISYAYDAIGQVTAQQETDATKTKYLDYDVTGKVTALYADANRTQAVARYTYNEFGQRLTQQVFPTPADQTTFTTTTFVRDVSGHELASYVAETKAGTATPAFLYEQPIYGATRLGVLRQARDQTPTEQLYELNDQLGNTRVVFRQPVVTTYALSLEDGRVSQEKQDFPGPVSYTYDAVRSAKYSYGASAYNGSSTSGTHYSAELLAQQGPSKTIAAQRGDKLHVTAYALYNSALIGRQATNPGTILGAAAAALGGITFNAAPRKELVLGGPQPAQSGWQQALSRLSLGISIPLLSRAAKTPKQPPLATTNNGTPPSGAGLQYVVRKASDNSVVRSGTVPVPNNGNVDWQLMTLDVTVTESYPVLVEVSALNNDNMVAAYFDDLTVQYTPGPVIEENHFYAYGQRIDGLSWRRTDERLYGRGYQGQNTTQDAESGYTAFNLRLYDARYGRWLMGDPARQHASPYVGLGNNPVSRTDADGGFDTIGIDDATGERKVLNDFGGKEFDIIIHGTFAENGAFSSSQDATFNFHHPDVIQKYDNVFNLLDKSGDISLFFGESIYESQSLLLESVSGRHNLATGLSKILGDSPALFNQGLKRAQPILGKLGKTLGTAGIIITVSNTLYKSYTGQDNTSTWVDAGITIGLAALAFTPAAPALALGLGIAYGAARLGWGDDIDGFIDNKIGFRNR